MVRYYLLGEYNGQIRILIDSCKNIEDKQIGKYIKSVLHKHLNSDDVKYIMAHTGEKYKYYKFEKNEEDKNGLYKIYRYEPGYILNSKILLARFWIDSFDKTIDPKSFTNGTIEGTPEENKTIGEILEPIFAI